MKRTSNPFQGLKVDLRGEKLTETQKDFLGNLVVVNKLSARYVGEYYNLSNSTICKYSNNILDGVSNNKTNGRPSKWDQESTSKITDILSGEKRIQINSEEYTKLLVDEAQQTSNRSGTKTVIANRDIKRFEDRNKVITDNNPEFTTEARDKACSNFRNCFATACAYQDQANSVAIGL